MNETYDIIDSIPAYSIEMGDQIIINDELIEVYSVTDESNIIVRGYSNSTGDIDTFVLDPDTIVDVWTV